MYRSSRREKSSQWMCRPSVYRLCCGKMLSGMAFVDRVPQSAALLCMSYCSYDDVFVNVHVATSYNRQPCRIFIKSQRVIKLLYCKDVPCEPLRVKNDLMLVKICCGYYVHDINKLVRGCITFPDVLSMQSIYELYLRTPL